MENMKTATLIRKAVGLSNHELEEMFMIGLEHDVIGLGSTQPNNFGDWLNLHSNKLCSSRLVKTYLTDQKLMGRRGWLLAFAGLLTTWLPWIAAIAGAEILLRSSLENICKDRN